MLWLFLFSFFLHLGNIMMRALAVHRQGPAQNPASLKKSDINKQCTSPGAPGIHYFQRVKIEE